VSTTLYSIASDVNWNPQPAQLPSVFLDTTDYKPSEPERGRWAELVALLPEKRRVRLEKCGCFAVHTVKDTSAGELETVQPISCMDKSACSYCATRYANEAAADRLAKLIAVCTSARAGLVVVEARAALPEWLAAVKAEGCAAAEERGRACAAGTCRACDVARRQHEHAAELETGLRAAVVQAWQRCAAGTGGVYVTALEPRPAGGIDVVVRLLVPGVAASVSRGTADIGFFSLPSAQQLTAAWNRVGAPSGAALAVRLATTEAQIAREVAAAHAPTLERLRLQGGAATQAELRTLVRADGLSVVTRAGKIRRVQRSAWFGIFAGRNQGGVLRALGLRRVENEVSAKQLVIDHYKILAKEAEIITVQSTRTGLRRELPRKLWRESYCDINGAPLTAPDQPRWDRTAPWLEKLQHARKIAAGAGGSGPAFELKKYDGYRRAIRKEFGAPLRTRWESAPGSHR